jgi:tetratricopeptide (TPR) repeat protein
VTTAVTGTDSLIDAIRGHIDNKRYFAAEQEITQAIHDASIDASLLYALLAEIRNLQLDFDAAEEMAQKSLYKVPDIPEGKFQLANAWFGKQEIDQAAALFDELEPVMEKDPRFLAQRSRFFLHRHDLEKAIDYAVRASSLRPESSDLLALKARMLAAADKPSPKQAKKALEAARKAKQLDRNNSYAWRMLIRASLLAGGKKEFLKAIASARKAFPGAPEIETEIAQYQLFTKEYGEAEAALLRILAEHRAHGPAYRVLAQCYAETEQWEKAVERAYQALGFAPYDLRVWKLIGVALSGNDEPDHAMGWLHKAVVADPDDLAIATDYAGVLRRLHEFDASEDLFQQILAEFGDEIPPLVMQSYGLLLVDMERNSEAVEAFRYACEKLPDNIVIHMNLATALTNAGQFEEAREIYRKLWEQQPDVGEAYLYYTSVTKMAEDDELAEVIESHIDSVQDMKQREAMYYALAKIYEDKKDYTAAFTNLSTACAMHKERCGYNEGANLDGLRLIKSIFTKEFIEGLQGCGVDSGRPIFVLGMPRSGTTLVEQILASHPDIVGGGELFFMDTVLRNHAALVDSSRVVSLSDLTCDQVAAMAEEYLAFIAPVGPADKHIVDKMPHNFLHIGLIHLMYPNAKIIHVKRNPMAICFSCFKQRFTEGHFYSFDIEDLGRYYLVYEELMEHWNRVLPGRVFQVEYETLTGDFEQQVREMIDYCGLEWNDACLEFHKSERAVRTASLEQVRNPIYTKAVEFWRNYEEQLKPLSEILTQGGVL